MKRLGTLIAAVIIIASGCAQSSDPGIATGSLQPVRTGSGELVSAVEQHVRAPGTSGDIETQLGITSHHLPTAEPLISALYRELKAADGPRDTFVVVGPDHFERCAGSASTSVRSYETPFGVIYPETEIIDALITAGVAQDDTCIEGEHSISVQAVFIRAVFPEATIVPLLFSASVDEGSVQKISDALEPLRSRITVIGSVDFSHYHVLSEAERIDQETEALIRTGSGDSLTLTHTDSPAAVLLVLRLAQKFAQPNAMFIDHANSADYTGQIENTTSYFSILFAE